MGNPRKGVSVKAELPTALGGRHFGPELCRFIVYRYRHYQTTQPLLLEQLQEYGIGICAGKIEWILSSGHEQLNAETDALLKAGLQSSSYVTVGDSSGRHKGQNRYVTHTGNDTFGWFKSTASKSRFNFLDILRTGHKDYRLTHESIQYMERCKLPLVHVNRLRAHIGVSLRMKPSGCSA